MKKMLFLLSFLSAMLFTVAGYADTTDEVAWENKPLYSVSKLLLNNDGSKLYVACDTASGESVHGILEVNTQDGKAIRLLRPGVGGAVGDMEISKDNSFIAAITNDIKGISLINLQTGKEFKLLTSDSIVSNDKLYDITLSPDGKTVIMIMGMNITAEMMIAFDIESGKCIYFKEYHYWSHYPKDDSAMVFDRIEFAPDGSYFATVGNQSWIVDKMKGTWASRNEIDIWDTKTFSITKRITHGFNTPRYFKFSKNINQFGFAHDNVIDFYDSKTFIKIDSIVLPSTGGVSSFDYSQNSNKLVMALYDGNKQMDETFDLSTSKGLYHYQQTLIGYVTLSPDDKYFYGTDNFGIQKVNAYWESNGINDNQITVTKLSVYPNPATNEVTIDIGLQKPSPCQVNISDATGKTIVQLFNGISEIKKTFIFKTHGLPPGTYFVNLKIDDSLSSKQFVVVR